MASIRSMLSKITATALAVLASFLLAGASYAADVPSINALIQPRWDIGDTKGVPNTFSIRRSEIALGAKVDEQFEWRVMIDPASSTLFKDAWIKWHTDLGSGAVKYIQVGQFKVPLTLEGTYSSAKIKIHDRPMIDRLYGDVRTVGIETGGVVGGANYRAMIGNGMGEDQPPKRDNNGHKALMGRAWMPAPFVSKDLVVGVSVGMDTSGQQYRLGTDVAWESNPYSVRAEVMTGSDRVGDKNLTRTGYWVQGAYLIPGTKWEPVARFDVLDSSNPKESEKDITLGVSYYVSPHVKVQVSGTRKMMKAGDNANVANIQATLNF